MIFEPFQPFMPAAFRVKVATEPWERRDAAALRREVFCGEQGLFGEDDHDEIDAHATPLVAVSQLGVAADAVVGTVRIHEAEPRLWWGSRLAVAGAYRKAGALGSALIQLAVATAHSRGCRQFLAHVQAQNVILFRRLHWRTVAEVDLHGRPHHRMEADLAFYPPVPSPETGFLALPRRAA